MLKLTNKDKETIEISYKTFLINIKNFIEMSCLTNGIECYKVLYKMLINGQFSIDRTMCFDTDFNYLNLPNIYSDGAQVMQGVCCCRYVSTLFNDILLLIGYNAALCYIYVDDNETWHITTAANSNHVVVLLKENNDEYILDPMNNLVLKKEYDNQLTLVDTNTVQNNYFIFSDNNVENIGKVLKKYYHLKSLGIDNIYDYD